MPIPTSWPVMHGDGRIEQLVLANVNTPISSSLTVAVPTLLTVSADVDCFVAVGSVGINPKPPASGGVGRPLYAGAYRDFLVSPGYVYRVAGVNSLGSVYGEMQG